MAFCVAGDEDYVDDPLATVEDIANEDADMEGLENEACDDARKDTGAVAGENDSASGEKSVAAGEKDVATGEKDVAPGEKDVAAGENDDAASVAAGEKDVAAGENDDAASFAAGQKDVAAGENDDAASVAAGEKDVAAGENDDAASFAAGQKDVAAGENDDAASFAVGEKDVAAGENDDATSVAASEKDDAAREKAVAADAKATAAEPGDNNALADTDYARAFVDAARTNAIEESRKRKQLSVPYSRKSCHGAFEMNESEDPSPKRPKAGTESLGSTGAHFTASAKSKIVRRRTKTYDSREKMMKAHQAVENVKPPLPVRTFDSWETFQEALRCYEAENYLHYRVRSSETRAKCNRTVNVVEKGVAKWKVTVDLDSEISTHNHKTSKNIYDSYRGAKSLSVPPQGVL
ncbi:hypothetical protein PInf_020321 [Phytophthora infestans]|nr:hypothetical protein PInf_020321 [Phytophthora infestans]